MPDSPHLSSARSCSWDLVAAPTGGHRVVLAIRPKARVPGAASTCRSNSSGHPPPAPRPLRNLRAPLRGQHGWQARGLTPPMLGGDPPPPWDACKPGPPKSQGAERTSQEESQTGPPEPSPSTSKVRPKPTQSPGCLRASGGPAQGGRQERGPERWPGRAAAPKEQARAGVAVPLSRLITIHIHFRIERVVEQSPTLKRKPHLGLSPPPWPPASRDVGPPKTR